MTADLLRAAAELSQVLAHENAALASMDLAAAAALVPAKRDAADAFAHAHARVAAANALTPPTRAALNEAGLLLRGLAAENRRLLDRAMTVQNRVLDIISQAVPRASAQAPRYGAGGGLVGRNHALPVAITASA